MQEYQYILAIILVFAKLYGFTATVLLFSIIFGKTAVRDRIILQVCRRDLNDSPIIALLWHPFV